MEYSPANEAEDSIPTTWNPMEIGDSLATNNNDGEGSKSVRLATLASWIVNWFLLVAKAYVVIISGSKAVTAALVDSGVDLASQGILALADRYMSKHSPEYPVGRSRLEALSVIACAFIMTMCSVEVIQFSAVDLYSGLHGSIPQLEVSTNLYIILSVGIGLKFVLWLYCLKANEVGHSDQLAALAEDHFNDVISNTVAIATVAIASGTIAWWVDPAGAILISLVIIYRWGDIIKEQTKKIVGYTAPPEYIEKVQNVANEHDSRLIVDCTRVYHFGAKYNVEMEIVLPGTMTVMESHDLALALQHKIESLPEVERAFVHVDHQKRDGLEHRVERELVKSALFQQNENNSSSSSVNGSERSSLRSRFPASNKTNEEAAV